MREILNNLIRGIYNQFIRPNTRKKISVNNGIAVGNIHLYDFTEEYPEHKKEFINPLCDNINEGDTVIQVGSGVGTSTLAAAEEAGSSGKVITYEASENRVNVSKDTIRLNNKTWRDRSEINIEHALIGDAVKVPDNLGNPKTIAPEELPECDILGLDCEGAEVGILEGITIRPDKIVVESHGWLGGETKTVKNLLKNIGYEIDDVIEQVPNKDNFVIVGSLSK
jgi:hypothetical protein